MTETATKPNLIIRDLPGIDRLEDKLLLYHGQFEGRPVRADLASCIYISNPRHLA